MASVATARPTGAAGPTSGPAPGPAHGPAPGRDRRFYAGTRAIGRFGMRLFEPATMPAPHWHGHVEGNVLTGGSMTYVIDDRPIEIEPGRLHLFWAGVPHRLVRLTPSGDAPMRLANLYLPLDVFLHMPHLARLQVTLLSGGLVALDPALCGAADMERWYRDYRSGDAERRDILCLEVAAVMRRAQLGGLTVLRAPMADAGGAGLGLGTTHMGHVVAMMRFIMENLAEPMRNADVARVTGLHETYALSLFTQALRVPMRRFIIRMRLMRARALLMASRATVAKVAEEAGFASLSQFHDHFRRAFGTTPQAFREGR